jgi:transcriptional regulator with XRE-family HTH domain
MTQAGKALKMVLEIYGINQNQLAIAMGIGRSSINRWVKENRDPVANAVLEIRKGLREINPEAAEKFIQFYLDDPVEEQLQPFTKNEFLPK